MIWVIEITDWDWHGSVAVVGPGLFLSVVPIHHPMESEFEKSVRELLAREPFGIRGIPRESMPLFCAALTHDSYSNEARDMDPPRLVESYERLEFLGDAILEFVVCERVYRYTDLSEGAMTDYKQDKVCNHMISERLLASGADLDSVMRVGGGHRDSRSNRIEENMRSDSFEAILAAVYLTFGMDCARGIVDRVILS